MLMIVLVFFLKEVLCLLLQILTIKYNFTTFSKESNHLFNVLMHIDETKRDSIFLRNVSSAFP